MFSEYRLPAKVCASLAQATGNTPLVALRNSVADLNKGEVGLNVQVFAKIEYMNPMGSVKDRIARHIIKKAIKEGKLKPGDTIVENSSGNTAMGLAMMAIAGGFKCKMVVRSSTSKEKLDCLRAVGVDLVLVDGSLPPEHPESYNKKARLLAKELDNAFFPDQHNNRDNNEAHYMTTGPEIWDQMDGKIDYLVAGIGTGGTICGASKFLKEQDPKIKVIAVDPVGSVFYSYFKSGKCSIPAPCLLEGLGDEEIIGCPDFELIDDIIQVGDKESFFATRELAKTEAILAGGSSGAALLGVRKLVESLKQSSEISNAKRIASQDGEPLRIVTIFPDSGSRYLSTIYNDQWMKQKGFM